MIYWPIASARLEQTLDSGGSTRPPERTRRRLCQSVRANEFAQANGNLWRRRSRLQVVLEHFAAIARRAHELLERTARPSHRNKIPRPVRCCCRGVSRKGCAIRFRPVAVGKITRCSLVAISRLAHARCGRGATLAANCTVGQLAECNSCPPPRIVSSSGQLASLGFCCRWKLVEKSSEREGERKRTTLSNSRPGSFRVSFARLTFICLHFHVLAPEQTVIISVRLARAPRPLNPSCSAPWASRPFAHPSLW